MKFDRPVLTFLANDPILHWALPFLESLRQVSPDLPLLLIPYDERTERLRALAPVYDFAILEPDHAAVDAFAEIAFPDRGHARNRLRKLGMFDITAPAVGYIDVDVVVLQDLGPLLRLLAESPERRVVYGTESRSWTYRTEAELLPAQAAGRQFSTGFFALSGPPLGTAALLETVRENLVDYLLTRADGVIDQPVVNFAIDLLRVPVVRVSELMPDLSARNWSDDGFIRERDGVLRDEAGRTVPFLHWAGLERMHPAARFAERHAAMAAAAEARRAAPRPMARTTEPIGIFCKSFREDFGRLGQMLATLEQCNVERIPFAVSLPADDIGAFRERFPEAAFPVLADHELAGVAQGPEGGWVYQQVVKLCSDRAGLADSLFVVDADFYFIRPFGRADFLGPDGAHTRLSPHGHDARNLAPVLEALQGGAEPTLDVARLRQGRLPDLSGDRRALRAQCRGTDLSAVFARPRQEIACMAGPVLHGDVLRLMRERSGDAGVAALIGLAPCDAVWHAEYLLASGLPMTVAPLIVFHVPDADALEAARRHRVTDRTLAARYIAVAMAARHMDEWRL